MKSTTERRRLPRLTEIWNCGPWGTARVTRVLPQRRDGGRVELTVTIAAPDGGNNTMKGEKLSLLLRDFDAGCYTLTAAPETPVQRKRRLLAAHKNWTAEDHQAVRAVYAAQMDGRRVYRQASKQFMIGYHNWCAEVLTNKATDPARRIFAREMAEYNLGQALMGPGALLKSEEVGR